MKYHYTATVKNVRVLNRQTHILTVQPDINIFAMLDHRYATF